MILFSCDKEYDFQSDNKVAVNTLESSEITKNSVKIKAVINTNNGSKLTERGVCYSLSTNPTIAPARASGNDRIIGNGRMNATPARIQEMTLRVESFFFSPLLIQSPPLLKFYNIIPPHTNCA